MSMFVIVNGLYIGWLPDKYDDANPIEHVMLNLAQPMKMIRCAPYNNSFSRVLFSSQPSTPVSLQPREVVVDGTIGVTMVGCMTS